MANKCQLESVGCRACTKVCVKNEMSLLFKEKDLAEMFRQCTSLEIDEDDDLPEYICNGCYLQLREFDKFRLKCLTSELFYKGKAIKVEPLEVNDETIDSRILKNSEPSPKKYKSIGNNRLECNDSPPDINNISDDEDNNSLPLTPGIRLTTSKKRKAPSKAIFRCELCNKFFQKKHRIQAHMREHCGLKPYECEICKAQFTKWNTYATHSQIQHKVKVDVEVMTKKEPKVLPNFQCDMCGKVCHKKHRIIAHLRQHMGLKPFYCEECNVDFLKWSSFNLHNKTKHSEVEFAMFTCDIDGCDKTYKLKASLKVHKERNHFGIPKPTRTRVICETCGRSFQSHFFLKEHMYRHGSVDSYPFACDICPKRFVAKYKLKLHMLRHNNIKNFQCHLCDMRTTTRRELDVHVAYHNKDIPFPCKLCTRIFTSHVALNRHKRTAHRGFKPYVCTYCHLGFSKSDTLKHHTMRHTGEKPHACTMCDRRFIQSVALKAHLKTHNKRNSNAGMVGH